MWERILRVLPILNVLALLALLAVGAHFYARAVADAQIVKYHNSVIVPMTRPTAPPGGK